MRFVSPGSVWVGLNCPAVFGLGPDDLIVRFDSCGLVLPCRAGGGIHKAGEEGH